MNGPLANDLQAASGALDDGQDQARRVGGIMVNAIDGLDEILLGFHFDSSPCVSIAIKAWKVRAGDLQADTMSALEDVGSGPQVEMQFVDLPWLHQFGL